MDNFHQTDGQQFYSASTLVGPWSDLIEQTRTNMFAMVCNYCRDLWEYILHLDSGGARDNSDSSDNSDICDSRQEPKCLLDIPTVCISKRHYLGCGGQPVCAGAALFSETLSAITLLSLSF